MSKPDENTHDPRAAREALAETRQSAQRTADLAREADRVFGIVRAHREANHYAEKFRAIIRGHAT